MTTTLRDVLIETLYSEFIDKVQLPDVVEFNELITELRDQFRVYLASPEVVASQIWPIIRRKESLFNTAMRLAMNFFFRLRERDMVELFNQSIAAMACAYDEVEAMGDGDLADKAVHGDELLQLPGAVKFIFYCMLETRLLIDFEAKVQGK